jgi:hypothetical protein
MLLSLLLSTELQKSRLRKEDAPISLSMDQVAVNKRESRSSLRYPVNSKSICIYRYTY